MNDLVSICVMGIITWGVCYIFDLVVRKKERMAIIEKLADGVNFSALGGNIDLNLFKKQDSSSWALRIALLMVGIGLGFLVGFIIRMCIIDMTVNYNWDVLRHFEILYPACICIFGGLGLFVAYMIERKDAKK